MTLLETRASSSPSMLVAWWMKPRHCISCRNSDFSGAVMSVGTSSTAISSAAASFMVKWRMPPMRADQPGVTDIPASRTPRDALGSMQATTVTSWWQRIMDGARAASRELHERRVREVSTKRREPTTRHTCLFSHRLAHHAARAHAPAGLIRVSPCDAASCLLYATFSPRCCADPLPRRRHRYHHRLHRHPRLCRTRAGCCLPLPLSGDKIR